jgi:hypothetical protein
MRNEKENTLRAANVGADVQFRSLDESPQFGCRRRSRETMLLPQLTQLHQGELRLSRKCHATFCRESGIAGVRPSFWGDFASSAAIVDLNSTIPETAEATELDLRSAVTESCRTPRPTTFEASVEADRPGVTCRRIVRTSSSLDASGPWARAVTMSFVDRVNRTLCQHSKGEF